MENKKPELRFPEFKDKWDKVKLKDVSRYYNGGSFENDVKEIGKYELITLKSIDVSGNLVHSKRFIDIEVPTLSKDTLVMILSEQAPGLLGMTALIPIDNKYVLNQRVAEIRPNNKVDSYFLSLAINRNQRYFSKHGAGTKVQNISKPNVENYEFLCPTLPEQTKIANSLTSIDKRINLLQKKKTELEQYKKGVMQKVFKQEIRFKDENGNDFPDWEEKRLGEVFSFLRGSGLSKNDIIPDGDNLCIHYGELFTRYSEIIDEVKSNTNSNGTKSIKGDILMPTSDVTPDGLATASAVFKDNVVLGGDINVLRPKSKVNSSYFSYLLNFSKKDIIKLVTGTTVKHIYSKDVKLLKFNVPSFEEQVKIAKFLVSIDKSIEQTSYQIDESKKFKKGLLQKMFI